MAKKNAWNEKVHEMRTKDDIKPEKVVVKRNGVCSECEGKKFSLRIENHILIRTCKECSHEMEPK